ncbi:MAG: acyltransferase [Gordonia sp. (in: high G+C Gram-positive bacteria)]
MTRTRPSSRLPALTGVRTLAALAVCLTHAAFWTGHYTDDYLGRFWSRFEIGVALFFVLSGLLLFTPWVRALQTAGRSDAVVSATGYPSVRRYAWHRAWRILPAYWVGVILVYLIYLHGDAGATGLGWSGFLRNMTFTQVYGYGHLHVGLTQMWSMTAEVAYYLALPLVAWPIAALVCRGRWRPEALVASLAVLLTVSPVWTLAVDGLPGVDPTARMWPPAFASWFVGGMLLAAVRPLLRSWPATPSVLAAVLVFAVSAGAAAGEPTIIPSEAGATIFKHTLYLVAAVALIGPLTLPNGQAGGDRWWRNLCASRPMIWFGEISYEFFLVHVMVLELVMRMLGYQTFQGSLWVAFAVTTVISVPVAWLLHLGTYRLWRRDRGCPAPSDSGQSEL